MKLFRRAFCCGILVGVLGLIGQTASAATHQYFVYFGTYTGFKYVHHGKPIGVGSSRSKGIYVSRFSAETGSMSQAQLAASIVNPSFLAVRPDNRFLYAMSEDPQSVGPSLDHASYVSAFAIQPKTGKLRLLNTVPTGGTSTCFLSLDKTGRYVFLANFGDGSVSVIRVKDDGSLGRETAFIQEVGHSVRPGIQAAPHPHSILVSPDNRYVIVSDLGLDKIFIYHFDAATGKLSPPNAPFVSVRPGTGPRHFTFGRWGKFGYQLSEFGGIISVFAWDPSKCILTHIQDQNTIPNDFQGHNDSAEIEISPDGKFLYESNRRRIGEFVRGPETIGVYAIDPVKGTLTEVQQILSGGKMPRSFAIDPTGSWLLAAHELTNNIVLFRVDKKTGRLMGTRQSIDVYTPVCIKFVPASL
jgi:6-phosphogluconolactonase